MLRVGPAGGGPRCHANQSQLAHQPLDPLAVDAMPQAAQIHLHLAAVVKRCRVYSASIAASSGYHLKSLSENGVHVLYIGGVKLVTSMLKQDPAITPLRTKKAFLSAPEWLPRPTCQDL